MRDIHRRLTEIAFALQKGDLLDREVATWILQQVKLDRQVKRRKKGQRVASVRGLGKSGRFLINTEIIEDDDTDSESDGGGFSP